LLGILFIEFRKLIQMLYYKWNIPWNYTQKTKLGGSGSGGGGGGGGAEVSGTTKMLKKEISWQKKKF
jgi:hypothetical protein